MKKYINCKNFIYLTVFSLPMYLIRFKFWGISTNVLEILILTLFVVWALNKNSRLDIREGIYRYKTYLIFTSLILLGLASSLLTSGNYEVGLGIIKGWFLFPLLFLIVAGSILEKDEIKNVFRALYLSAFLVAGLALIYLFLGRLTYDGRLEGFFNSPNYLAMYLAPGMIIGFVDGKNLKLRKVLFLFSLAVIVIAFWKTFSYASWASVIIAIVIALAFKKQLHAKKLFLLIGIAFLFFSQLNTAKFGDLSDFSSRSSLSSRFMIWNASEKILKDNWVWGIGPGNFQKRYLEYQKYFPPYLEWAVPHPHNLYLTFWLYSGIIGLAGFLGLVFWWFKKALRKRENEVVYLALGIMLYILIHGLVDTTYFKNDLAIIFWLNFIVLKVND